MLPRQSPTLTHVKTVVIAAVVMAMLELSNQATKVNIIKIIKLILHR